MPFASMLVGLVVGAVVGLTGMGGGALLTPALVLVLGVEPTIAIGSGVFIASGIKLFGGGAYALQKQVDWRLVKRLAAGSVPGALVGVVVLNHLPPGVVDTLVGRGVGIAMLLAACATLRRVYQKFTPAKSEPRARFTVMLGFATGFLVATTSVGSGSVLMCVLLHSYPLEGRKLVGTDLVHALVLSLVATAGHALSGRVDVGLAAGVLVGAVPGVLIASRLAGVIPDRVLRTGLAAILIVAGLQMTFASKSPRLVDVAEAEAVR